MPLRQGAVSSAARCAPPSSLPWRLPFRPCRMLLGKSKKDLGKLRHRWLRMDVDGELCEVTMGKAAIHHKYGVQVSCTRPASILLQGGESQLTSHARVAHPAEMAMM